MAVTLPIYMDNHATTPVDPRVFEAMTPFLTEKFGNPASSNHIFGWQAREAVENARRQVAALISAQPSEIVFTSGATESNNLAVKGAAHALRDRGDHVITCAIEHKSVLDSCKRLAKEGFRVTVLPVDGNGQVDPAAVQRALDARTILVSIMAANNEVGTLQPVADVARICAERGVLFHSDAVQAVGKIPFDVQQVPADMISLTAHKIYGPKGVGALYVRRKTPRIELEPLIDGGGHEGGLRSGTLAAANIAGLGMACELARLEMPAEAERLAVLRNRLCDGLCSRLPGVQINGHPTERLPGNLNASFPVDGESLMFALNDVAVSSGSACSSASVAASYVLLALGVTDERAQNSIRFGLGRFNTQEEVDYVIERVCTIVEGTREVSAT